MKWKIQNDLKLVFAIMYKEILQLAFVEELLDMIRYDFVNRIYPQLSKKGDIFLTLPTYYDNNFSLIWKKWEAKAKELKGPKQMKTFDQTSKGKKVKEKQQNNGTGRDQNRA